MKKDDIIKKVSPPLDAVLVEQLLAEFADQEERYVLSDWKPSTLDGGRFAEAAARILYHQDSGRLDQRRAVGKCLDYVEGVDSKGNPLPAGTPHSSVSGHPRAFRHLARVLRATYKFRSDRGAVHLDPEYTANEMDSRLVIENCRWVLAELLRLFWTGPKPDMSKIVRELLAFEIPVVTRIGSQTLVMRTDLSLEEEILVLLYTAGEEGLNRRALGEALHASSGGVTNALKKLASGAVRQVVLRKEDSHYQITPPGSKRVREELGHKLSLAPLD